MTSCPWHLPESQGINYTKSFERPANKSRWVLAPTAEWAQCENRHHSKGTSVNVQYDAIADVELSYQGDGPYLFHHGLN